MKEPTRRGGTPGRVLRRVEGVSRSECFVVRCDGGTLRRGVRGALGLPVASKTRGNPLFTSGVGLRVKAQRRTRIACRIVPDKPNTTAEQMELWLGATVEVFIGDRMFTLFSPKRGYVDLGDAFASLKAGSQARLYVITAWNPLATARADYLNRASEAALLLFLLNEHISYVPSRGWAPGWSEPGVAFLHPDDSLAMRLASRFGQLGYYSFTSAYGECVDVSGSFGAVSLVR